VATILISGGSLGGLLAARMLMRDGHDVHVLEKSSNLLNGRGAGIVTHGALNRGLARAGVDYQDNLGVKVTSRVALNTQGDVVATLELPQLLTSWSRLYALLIEGFPSQNYHRGVTVTHIEQGSDSVCAQTEKGDLFVGDLMIASDGIRSAVREQFAPQIKPGYASYVAWRGVCDEAALSKKTLSSVFDHFSFGLPPGEQLIAYPVAGAGDTTARGQRRYNFVWYRPAGNEAVLCDLLTDADGEYFPEGISPNRVSWRHVAAMREAGRTLLAPQFAEILEKTAQPFIQPIYDVMSEQLAFNRVALMGDAAFVARPHVGMGVTKAAEDAMALSDCVNQHGATPAALKAYEHMRLLPGKNIVKRGRQLGAYMQSQGLSGEGQLSVSRSAQTVMRETAVYPTDFQACSVSATLPHSQNFPGHFLTQ
jgi:2-polyprenyl-6-methoxyphenol hydroxylase-like FAD-dependent oxidoreductase